MKAYAEFSELRNGAWTVPCGSFAIIALDARMNLENMKQVSEETCRQRGYGAYQVFRGNLKSARKLTPLIPLKGTEDESK